jgi:LPXTG-site transpeptidase (sortase) family protein
MRRRRVEEEDSMNGLRDWLARLRENETLRKATGGRPEIAIIGVPVVLVAAIAAVVIGVVAMSGGGSDGSSAQAPTATQESTLTPTAGANTGEKTPIPVSPGDVLTEQDLAARGAGVPGRGDFLGARLLIPAINVDAPFSEKVVPGSGQMPNPNGPSDVAFYDFSAFDGLGGLPGAGGNVVVAGHVDYINYGPAVFWDLDALAAGDTIQVRMQDGSVIEYTVVFNKHIGAGDADWSSIVAATDPESITLITCTGEFSAGHYNNRQIVWAQRV